MEVVIIGLGVIALLTDIGLRNKDKLRKAEEESIRRYIAKL